MNRENASSVSISLAIATLLTASLSLPTANAQSRRAPQIRSCLTSEFALAIIENADSQKSDFENFEVGKRLGYIITEYYENAIWAMGDPETEGRAVVMYATNNPQDRAKYASRDQLRRDVRNCRQSFQK